MKDIIEMAREAGFDLNGMANMLYTVRGNYAQLARFVELVRADALVKPCCQDFIKCQQVCMPRAAADEREACAKVCDAFQARDVGMQPAECAGAIRARSNT